MNESRAAHNDDAPIHDVMWYIVIPHVHIAEHHIGWWDNDQSSMAKEWIK